MFLTDEELAQLTGRERSDCQRRWLTQNGWKFAVNLNGRPVVSRAYAEFRLGGMTAAAELVIAAPSEAKAKEIATKMLKTNSPWVIDNSP